MISPKLMAISGLALIAAPLVNAQSKAQYQSYVSNATEALNRLFYNSTTGQWGKGWWESGALITSLANAALVQPALAPSITPIIANSFQAAPIHNPYGPNKTFLDSYYDDEGWWATGWIQAYDLTGNTTYLNAAVKIWQDMLGGLNATCGGHLWSKSGGNTAIGNALWLTVSAALGNRIPSNSSYYRSYAQDSATFFLTSPFINRNGSGLGLWYLHDSISVSDNTTTPVTCSGSSITFSYDMGQFIGGLVEFAKLSGNTTYLDVAERVANGTIAKLAGSGNGGILTDIGAADSGSFKGVFLRGLMGLLAVRQNGDWVKFVQNNADTVWGADRADNGSFGQVWKGPASGFSQGAQGSAIDLFVAAVNVTAAP